MAAATSVSYCTLALDTQSLSSSSSWHNGEVCRVAFPAASPAGRLRTSTGARCTLAVDRTVEEEQRSFKDFQRPDASGRFGKFGGQYVPETLMTALHELEAAYKEVATDETFQVSSSLSVPSSPSCFSAANGPSHCQWNAPIVVVRLSETRFVVVACCRRKSFEEY